MPSHPERLQLVQRMSALLQRELGEGIDSQRMLAQPLYARDVLLVCQALRDTELPSLAERYNRGEGAVAATTTPPVASGVPVPDSNSGVNSDLPDSAPPSGWRASLWPATMRASLFGALGSRVGRGKKRDATPRS